MKLRDIVDHPITTASRWAEGHERFFALYVTAALAVAFLAVSVVFLLKSLGLL